MLRWEGVAWPVPSASPDGLSSSCVHERDRTVLLGRGFLGMHGGQGLGFSAPSGEKVFQANCGGGGQV